MISRALASIAILCSLACGQQAARAWQEQVRQCAESQDWATALSIVDREIARAPQDADVRSWRARVLAWSGALAQAEGEYRSLLVVAPADPDNWMGLASVYSRQGRTQEALQALDRAVELDPKRVDLRLARARALRAANQSQEARREFQTALSMAPASAEARRGLLSLRGEPRHELRIGMGTDLFNFTSQNHDEELSLASQWSSHWRTTVAGSGYQRGGVNGERLTASLTGKTHPWGALTAGGATAHDNGVVPKAEAFFDYGYGWRLTASGPVRAVEASYAQHWYWYATARILTINGAAVVYLPKEWTWSLGLSGARSQFSGTGTEWRPAGTTRLGFPLKGWNERRLGGKVFFAVGTENYAQLDQIGRFSSQTYGGELRLQLTPRQDVTGFAAYQRRTQDRTETSFGYTYGLRF